MFLIFRKSQEVSKLYLYLFKSARYISKRIVSKWPPLPAMDRVKHRWRCERKCEFSMNEVVVKSNNSLAVLGFSKIKNGCQGPLTKFAKINFLIQAFLLRETWTKNGNIENNNENSLQTINSKIRNKQNQIFWPKTGIPVYCRILSVLIRFLSTGTGFSNHQSGSYWPEPEFWTVIPVSYQPEPEFRLSIRIPVLNPVPVVP